MKMAPNSQKHHVFDSDNHPILKAIPAAVIITDQNGDILSCNDMFAELLALPRDARRAGQKITGLLPEKTAEINSALDKTPPLDGAALKLNNEIDLQIIPYLNTLGEQRFLFFARPSAACADLAPTVDNTRLLIKDLDLILDSSYDGIVICDSKGRVLRSNRAAERINYIKNEIVLGKEMVQLVEDGLFDRSVTLEVLKEKTTVTILQQLKDGKRILVTGTPVFDEKGEIAYVITNVRDITELINLKQELEHSRALARQYQTELSSLKARESILQEIDIQSRIMQRVFDTAMKVSQFDSSVLILGESGVGKSMLAKMIHRATEHRHKAPFIRVDCGAIPESLIESELFGYEKGAFTGARAEGKPGLFEMADGGTLFLDEVGDLPPAVQVKLLRFMEEFEFVRVGGTKAQKIDVRIIAATNRNLDKLIKAGQFRRDLFFRLSVVPLEVPPLRERTEDITALSLFFLKKFNDKFKTRKTISQSALDCLCRYQFPGNVRELSNLIEQLVVLSSSETIEKNTLPLHVREGDLPMGLNLEDTRWNLAIAVQDLEKRMIRKALKLHGNQRDAAAQLGINQSTLARKALKYGLRKDAILHHDANSNQTRVAPTSAHPSDDDRP